MYMRILLLISFLFVIACSSSGVVKLSDDTYMLRRVDSGGYIGETGALKSSVIDDANSFAKEQGMVAIPVSSHVTPKGENSAKWTAFEYKFRLVDKEESQRLATEEKAKEVTKNETKSSSDLHTELIQLDDLRKKNIITDEEFQIQKTKILNRN